MGTKDYDSSFCRGLVFCTQFKNTFALSILTYPQKQQSQTGVCCICVCPQLIIPSGKSILLLGIFMPFGAVKGGQSHENNQYWNSCPCRRWKDDLDGEPAICQRSHFRTGERRKRDNEDGHHVFGAAACPLPSPITASSWRTTSASNGPPCRWRFLRCKRMGYFSTAKTNSRCSHIHRIDLE